MSYTATNDYTTLDATKPLDTEDAGQIGPFTRETRLVAKTTLENVHTSKGRHQVAILGVGTNLTATANTVFSTGLGQISDIQGLTDGASTPAVLVAGTYRVRFLLNFYRIGFAQALLYNGSAYVGFGTLVACDTTSAVVSASVGDCVLTIAANTIFTLRGITNTNSGASLALGPAVPGGGSWPAVSLSQFYGYLTFEPLFTY